MNNNWRHDKKIVETFIEKNQYVINHGIINILPKTRKTLKPLWLQGFYLARKRGFEPPRRFLHALLP